MGVAEQNDLKAQSFQNKIITKVRCVSKVMWTLWSCSSRTETPSDKMMSSPGPQNSRPVSAPGQDAPAPGSAEENEVLCWSMNALIFPEH